ncbi:NmrA-like family protein [Xylariaceae sp. FL1019]|nr:NmrA-like family protein [Xylariaceae sp. FL1019]
MSPIKKVAIFGASGNFGVPTTDALIGADFDVTVFTRPESTSAFQGKVPVVRVDYADYEAVCTALRGMDAVVNLLNPAQMPHSKGLVDAAYRAGVGRFIINDFGWGLNKNALPEFKPFGDMRRVAWYAAMEHAREDEAKDGDGGFSWTGITIGNPLDWALRMGFRTGFDLNKQTATIYDDGTEEFTGTTLEGIVQSVLGVLSHPAETKNRFVKVRSIQVSQNTLLAAFQKVTGKEWTVERSTAKELLEEGRRKHSQGDQGWILDLLLFQLYSPGEKRCIVTSLEDSDNKLLGVREESAEEIVRKALA